MLATGLVVMTNVAEVAFAAIVTVAGICAAEPLLLDKVTIAPPAGAGPVNLTVPVDPVPPITDAGLTLTPLPEAARVAAVTVKLAILKTPRLPVIVTPVLLATGVVVTANVAVVAPAEIKMLAGTCAAPVLLLDNMTVAPPAGAGPFSVAVPVDVLPPNNEAGLTVMPLRVAAATARLVLCVVL